MDFIGTICNFCNKHDKMALIEARGGYRATFSANTKTGHARLVHMLQKLPGVTVEAEPWDSETGARILVKPE